jgi:hypothetical protein
LKPNGLSTILHFFAADESESLITIGIGGLPNEEFFFAKEEIGFFIETKTDDEGNPYDVYQNNRDFDLGYPSDDVIILMTDKGFSSGTITVGVSQYILALPITFGWVALFATFYGLHRLPKYVYSSVTMKNNNI